MARTSCESAGSLPLYSNNFWVSSLAFCSFVPRPADRTSHFCSVMPLPKKPRGSGACVWTIWRDVKLQTATPFSNRLILLLAILHGFRNLSIWERYGSVEREGPTSNSLDLALAMAMAAFTVFRSFQWPTPVRLKGLFLHVRCIPQQNSQWQFWARVCVRVKKQT